MARGHKANFRILYVKGPSGKALLAHEQRPDQIEEIKRLASILERAMVEAGYSGIIVTPVIEIDIT